MERKRGRLRIRRCAGSRKEKKEVKKWGCVGSGKKKGGLEMGSWG